MQIEHAGFRFIALIKCVHPLWVLLQGLTLGFTTINPSHLTLALEETVEIVSSLFSLNEPLSFPPTLSSCFSTLLCFQTPSSGPMFMTLFPFLNKTFSTGFVFSRNMWFFLIKDYRKLLNAVTNTMTTTPTTPTATATINSSNTKMESKDCSNFRLMAGWQEEGVKISHEPLSQAHTLLV